MDREEFQSSAARRRFLGRRGSSSLPMARRATTCVSSLCSSSSLLSTLCESCAYNMFPSDAQDAPPIPAQTLGRLELTTPPTGFTFVSLA